MTCVIVLNAGLEEEDFEVLLDHAFWEYDARSGGTGPWQGAPQHQREAFKAAVRALVARLAPPLYRRGPDGGPLPPRRR